MDYTILLNESDKSLVTTKYIPIYQYEHNPCRFKFIIPISYGYFSPTLKIILPDGQKGKIMLCEYEPELYKGRYVFYVDIPNILTEQPGQLKIWISFMNEDNSRVIKTEHLYVNIIAHEGFNDIEIKDDTDIKDIATVIQELKLDVNTLKNTKADTVVLNNQDKTLALKSGDEILSMVNLPDDVTWEIL